VLVEIAEEHQRNKEENMTTVHDPVCGMDIDPANAVGSEEHEGETYYFCSKACQEAFKVDPSKYVG
jgi:Cu+-exporting ATPase